MALHRTPLFDWHRQHGGRIVEFGGWEMPVQYTSIADEHQAVRKAAGLFDISHMGRLHFEGPDARQLLDHLLTCRVDRLNDGQIRYGLVCNESGNILDDVLVNRIHSTSYGLVVNASNREKIIDWIKRQLDEFRPSGQPLDLKFEDQTFQTGMIAVQGPRALELINHISGTDLAEMKYYTGKTVAVQGTSTFISRTGYTGEDGFEVIAPQSDIVAIWERILQSGQIEGLKPCGLGCRDTLRLEAAMPLYGHELSDRINPIMAGLGSAVKLEKQDFIGRSSLLQIANGAPQKVRVGIKLSSRRIAREGSSVFANGEQIGEVTSGTFSPTLEQSIAMAYVTHDCATIGTAIEVDIRGNREKGEIVPLPFYQRLRNA